MILFSFLFVLFFLCSNSDSRLPETAQHEKQAGEQDRGCWAEEDPDGRHPGPPGPAGGENEQNSGFSRKQTEGMRRRCRAAMSHVSPFFFFIRLCQVYSFSAIFACIYMFVFENNVINIFAYSHCGFYANGYQSFELSKQFFKIQKVKTKLFQ